MSYIQISKTFGQPFYTIQALKYAFTHAFNFSLEGGLMITQANRGNRLKMRHRKIQIS